MGSLSKVVVLLSYIILPLEASSGLRKSKMAILGHFGAKNRYFTVKLASYESYEGSWLSMGVRMGLKSNPTALLPYMVLPLEASRGLRKPKNGHFGSKSCFSGHPRSDFIVKYGPQT